MAVKKQKVAAIFIDLAFFVPHLVVFVCQYLVRYPTERIIVNVGAQCIVKEPCTFIIEPVTFLKEDAIVILVGVIILAAAVVKVGEEI